jgi:hypothetical protein
VENGRQVYVNSDNKIGTLSSSRRYKEQIKPMDQASEAILALKPSFSATRRRSGGFKDAVLSHTGFQRSDVVFIQASANIWSKCDFCSSVMFAFFPGLVRAE